MTIQPHDLLGVKADASLAEIKAAYRAKIKLVHPDVGGDIDLFRSIQSAYDTLTEQKKSKSDPTANSIPRNRNRSVTIRVREGATKTNLTVTREDYLLGYDLDVTVIITKEVTTGHLWWKKTKEVQTRHFGTFPIPPKTNGLVNFNFKDSGYRHLCILYIQG